MSCLDMSGSKGFFKVCGGFIGFVRFTGFIVEFIGFIGFSEGSYGVPGRALGV